MRVVFMRRVCRGRVLVKSCAVEYMLRGVLWVGTCHVKGRVVGGGARSCEGVCCGRVLVKSCAILVTAAFLVGYM